MNRSLMNLSQYLMGLGISQKNCIQHQVLNFWVKHAFQENMEVHRKHQY